MKINDCNVLVCVCFVFMNVSSTLRIKLPILLNRRSFLLSTTMSTGLAASYHTREMKRNNSNNNRISFGITGDVMLGRGIDAILPYHVDGKLYEVSLHNESN